MLNGLAMEGASFEARITPRNEYGPSGGDDVEFLIAPNRRAGRPSARHRLGRRAVAGDAGAHGRRRGGGAGDARVRRGGRRHRRAGRRGRSAEQLRALAHGRQVICITHLPQIASMADRHFTIVKDTSADPARTTVTLLERAAVVGEIVRMLGADDTDAAARRHAKELPQGRVIQARRRR